MCNNNCVPFSDDTALQHDGHDPCLSDQGPFGGPVKDRRQKARLKGLDLRAWVSKPGDFDQRMAAQAKLCALAQPQQLDALGGDVFAHLTVRNQVSTLEQLRKKFRLQQMNLSQVGLCRVSRHPGPVLDGDTKVGIAPNTVTGDEIDLRYLILRKRMKGLAVNGEHLGVHERPFYRRRSADAAGGWMQRLVVLHKRLAKNGEIKAHHVVLRSASFFISILLVEARRLPLERLQRSQYIATMARNPPSTWPSALRAFKRMYCTSGYSPTWR